MKEEWKKVKGYSLYECSTLGRIKTFNWKNQGIERIMKPAKDANGYLRTMLKRDTDGKLCTIKVHRIIAQTFIDNPLDKPCVNHINSIKHDNRLSNLEWCTVSENIKHAYASGNHSVAGERNPATNLTDRQVLEIRSLYEVIKKDRLNGIKTMSRMDVADKYGVNLGVIKNIVGGRTWKHLL